VLYWRERWLKEKYVKGVAPCAFARPLRTPSPTMRATGTEDGGDGSGGAPAAGGSGGPAGGAARPRDAGAGSSRRGSEGGCGGGERAAVAAGALLRRAPAALCLVLGSYLAADAAALWGPRFQCPVL
jgi:hypothetical protein